MKLYSFVLRLIILGRLLAVRAQAQATEDANADDPFSDIWQSDDTTNMADDLSAVSGDDGAETSMTTQQQSEWRVTEQSTIISNQETIAVNINTTAMLHSNSETVSTVTEQLYQYEVSRASLTPDSIISNEATTGKTSHTPHMETQRDRLTSLEATVSYSSDGLSSNSAEDLTGGTDGGSTNYNNFAEVTAKISDETQGSYASELAAVSPVSMYSVGSGTTTLEVPLLLTEETRRTWPTTSQPTRTTTLSGTSSNAVESFTDGAEIGSTNNHYFTEVTVTQPDDVSEEASEIATTLRASVYSINSDATTVNVATASADEMQPSISTISEPTKTTTARGISSNAAEEFTDGTEGDHTNNSYFTDVTLTVPGVETEENVASETKTASLTSMYSIDSVTTTIELTHAPAEETQWSRSTNSEPTRTTTQSGISSNAAEDYTDGADGATNSNHYFTEVTVTEPVDETEGSASSETVTTPLASMYSADSGATTVEMVRVSTEKMLGSMSTALEPTETGSGSSSNAAEEFTAGAEGDNTSNHYFTDSMLTKSGFATEENVVSETITAPLASMYSVDSTATPFDVTYSSAEETQSSRSTTSEPTRATTANGISSNTAEEFTDGTDAESSNSHYSEVTSTKADESGGNAASETATVSLASMYSVASDAQTIEATNALAEETHWSMSTASALTKTTTERGTSLNAAEEYTADAEGDSTSNHYFSEATLTKPGEATEENAASDTVTASPNVVNSVDSSAATIELTHSSADVTSRSTSTTSKPTEMSTASGISSNTAEELTDGTDGDGTSNHYFTEVTLTESDGQTSGNVATDIVTASLASMYSSGDDATTIDVTHASAEEVQQSISMALEPTETSTTWAISSNAAEELTYHTDGDSTNKAFTEVTLTEPSDQTKENIASETMSVSLASMYSADSAATAVEVTYSSAEETQSSRSTTSEPTRAITANGISSNTAEEFTDGTDAESSNSHYSSELTSTKAEEPGGNAASETATVSQASMYSVASDAKTIEVTNALAEETRWRMSTTSEPTGMTTMRGTAATQLYDGHITSDRYFTDVTLTDPGDKTKGNAASETVTSPLASLYSLGSDAATITATRASPEIVQRSSSTAAEGEITNNAISLSSSAAEEFTDGTNGSSTDNKYFTVVTLTDPGDESDGSAESQVATTPLVLMSSIGGGVATVDVTRASTHEEQRSSFTTAELESVTNTNGLSSNAAEWSPGASNDSDVGSSYFTEQTSTVNGDATDGSVSPASLASMSSDGKTASAIDTSPPSGEDLHWSKTTILEEKGTTLVNTLSSSTVERSPFATNDDSDITEATLADGGSTIEDFDASVTPKAETANSLDVSFTTPSNETETMPTSEASSLGPPIENDTMAEIRRNNSVVVSLSISLAEYTKDFDYKFRSAVADAANDYCKHNSCYVSGSSGGDEGNGGRPRVRRAAVSPAPASPTTGGSTTASPTTEAASATTLAVLFTVADVGILPGYPVSNGEGGIDVATYLSPPAGFGLSAGSAKAFVVVSGTVLVAIISANRGAVADALGVNITGIIRLPEKIALDTMTSAQAAASTAAAATSAVESSLWVTLVASLVSVAAVLLAIAAVVLVVKKLKRQGSASVSPSITKLNVDDRPSTSSSGDIWYASGSAEISHARRNRNLLEELDVSTSLWYENSLPQEASMGRRRVYRIAKDVPTLQYSPPEDTSYFQCISPPPSYSALPPIRNNR